MNTTPASSPRVERVACNLCGKDDARPRFESLEGWPVSGEGHYAATTDKYGAYGTVVECRGCGLVYTNPRVAGGELLDEYEKTKDEDYFLESDARSMNGYLSLSVIRRFKHSGSLLDVGCSTGFFLNAARLSYEVEGVEPSRWARKFAREKLKLPVPHPTLEAARYPDGRFDIVTLNDVIEHVPDPLGLLKEVHRITKPGGLIYVLTPDINSLSARLLRGRWWGLRPAHIYYFSTRTLTAAAQKAGYEPLHASSYGRIFTWGYWLSRLSNYPRPVQRAVEAFIDGLGIRDKFLYLDTRDSFQLVARKKG